MKKRTRKLTLTFESLRNLDAPSLAGGAFSLIKTCQPSCAGTCGANPATTNQLAVFPPGTICA